MTAHSPTTPQKYLYLIRHANAEPAHTQTLDADFNRALSPRGITRAQNLGHALKQLSTEHQHYYKVSSARRTQQTWEAISAKIPPAAPADITQTLYLADTATLLNQIQTTPNHLTNGKPLNHLTLIGHNPGISNIGRYLCDTASDHRPTASALILVFAFDTWQAIHKNSGREFKSIVAQT